jgi:hypothetical protein
MVFFNGEFHHFASIKKIFLIFKILSFKKSYNSTMDSKTYSQNIEICLKTFTSIYSI